jgi:hypothetical protein
MPKRLLSNRANKRNELHSASLAGKGGLLLDLSKVQAEKEQRSRGVRNRKETSLYMGSRRPQVLDVGGNSEHFANSGWEDRKAGKSKIPDGTREELEGMLVEHTLNLCDQLEVELKQRTSSVNGRTRNHSSSERYGQPEHSMATWP